MRDDFPSKAKDSLGRRVGFLCSNPICGMSTVGPHSEPSSATNLGVAAHITAASPNGPRYDASLSEEARRAVDNGIWLCQSCAKLIDSDISRYSVDLLHQWKKHAEKIAGERLNKQLTGTAWEIGPAVNREAIQENGCYEKQLDGYKIRYFLQGNNLHVEQELGNGSIGYYIIDNHGNMVDQKLPYALEEYSVEIESGLVLKRQELALSGGLVKETILMKWGKSAVLVWDSEHRLKDFHFERGCRIDNIRKVFVLEAPAFKSPVSR